MSKNQKQVIFRLDEDVYCQFKSYLERKNTNMQKALEETVIKLIEYRETLSNNMQLVLKQLFENEMDKIKKSLYESCIRSLAPHFSNKYSVQVIVDEFGDIKVMETAPGWVPACAHGAQAYVLWEFASVNVIDFCSSYDTDILFDPDITFEPFFDDITDKSILSYREFAMWLRKNHEYADIEDENDGEYLKEIACRVGAVGIINLIYKWNPKALKVYHQWLLQRLETSEYSKGRRFSIQHEDGTIENFEPKVYRNLVEYHCLKIIRSILQREEMRFINLNVEIDEGPQSPFTDEEEQTIHDLFWNSLLAGGRGTKKDD